MLGFHQGIMVTKEKHSKICFVLVVQSGLPAVTHHVAYVSLHNLNAVIELFSSH